MISAFEESKCKDAEKIKFPEKVQEREIKGSNSQDYESKSLISLLSWTFSVKRFMYIHFLFENSRAPRTYIITHFM